MLFPGTPVEAIAEFIEVSLQVLVTDSVVGAQYESLGVGDRDVDPWQILRRLLGRYGGSDVLVAQLGEVMK